jgi:hypothetical protein
MTRLLLVTLVALAGLVGTAQASSPRSAAPHAVSPAGMLVQQSDLAAGGGRAVVLMAGIDRLLARVVDGRRIGPAQRLAGNAFDPQVAVGRDGTAVAAWVDHGRLRVALAAPGRRFGRARTLVRGVQLLLGGVGVTPAGRAVVAWRQGNVPTALIRAAVRPPGRPFGRPRTLGDSQYPPALAVAPAGTVIASWLTTARLPAPGEPPSFEGNPRLLASTLPASAASFTAPVELAGILDYAGEPQALAGPGGAAVAWRQMAVKRIAFLTADGRLMPVVPLATGPVYEELGDPLALGLTRGGRTVALWRDLRTRSAEDLTVTSAQVEASIRRADGSFAPEEQLSAPGRIAGAFAAAAVGDETVAAWSEHRGAGARLRVARLGARGPWSARRTVSSGASIGRVVHAAAQERRAVLAWVQRERGHRHGRMYLAIVER